MDMTRKAVGLLRILLVLLFTGLVVAQVAIMPGSLAYNAREDPQFAHLQWPLLAFSIIELLCVQVVIVCTWKLLSLVTRDEIFSEAAFGWVNAIVGAMAVAWVLFAGVFVYLVVMVADDPGVPVLMFGMLLTGGVIIMLMLVMRALLRQATNLRTEMEAVI